MPYLRCNEIDLWYECHGRDDAPALVLAHGAGGNHLVWWQQVPAFAEHFRGRDVRPPQLRPQP